MVDVLPASKRNEVTHANHTARVPNIDVDNRRGLVGTFHLDSRRRRSSLAICLLHQ